MEWVKGVVTLQLVVVLFVVSLSYYADGVVDEESTVGILVKHPPPPPPRLIKPRIRRPHLRTSIAVEGVIYCKSCKLKGYDKHLYASPLPGAIAKLVCYSSKHVISVNGTTDNNGYFIIRAPTSKVANFGNAHKCKVFLVSSPLPSCQEKTDIGGGGNGDLLTFEKIIRVGHTKWALYSAGFFEFSPGNVSLCPH